MAVLKPIEFKGSWSFSALMTYEQCALRFKLKRIDKLPEPPLPPDNPLERGSRVHDNFDNFVKGKTNVLSSEPKAVNTFEKLLAHNRELYAANLATAEEAWYFDGDWNETNTWEGAKMMAKLDFAALDKSNNYVVVVDYKTGKPDYKVVEHIQQLQFYAALTALKYEWANQIVAELWYVDAGAVRSVEWTREQALAFVGRFDARAQRIYNDRFFRANPSKITCRYCPYSPRGTGACPVGV
ncbi:MAG: hypothetical protein DDT39_00018 [Firmicutes bacterium]|nr:hypothetical protein [candidate division NPL-UPA2 bacterium]